VKKNIPAINIVTGRQIVQTKMTIAEPSSKTRFDWNVETFIAAIIIIKVQTTNNVQPITDIKQDARANDDIRPK